MNEAKKIFLKYLGSYYQMEREGELSKYYEFKIDKETEKQWLFEYQMELIEQLGFVRSPDIIFSRVCSLMKVSKSDSNLEWLINVTSKCLVHWDSFVKLRIAEELQDLIEFFTTNYSEDAKKTFKYKILVEELLRSIVKDPIVISEDTRQKVTLEDCLSDENLRKRAEKRLRKLKLD